MQVVVNALFQSIPASGNVLLVCFLFYLIFGILFVSLFKGTYRECDSLAGERLDPDYVLPVEQQPMTADWCQAGQHGVNVSQTAYHASIPLSTLPDGHDLASGNVYNLAHKWVIRKSNFDNIFAALLSLFEIATLELWLDYMYHGVDATGRDLQPLRDNSPGAALYFIAFIIVGSFFVLNLFVGVAIDKFNNMQAEHLGHNVFLTPEQEQWVTIQRMMMKCKPPKLHEKPAMPLRAATFNVRSRTAVAAQYNPALLHHSAAVLPCIAQVQGPRDPRRRPCRWSCQISLKS
jgi:Ion transport protein